MLNWFKVDGDFAEWVGFAYWWSCIWKGLRLQPAQQACLITQSVILCGDMGKKFFLYFLIVLLVSFMEIHNSQIKAENYAKTDKKG